MATQNDWFRCAQCQGLYFADAPPGSGVCPFDGNPHVHAGSWNYALVHDEFFAVGQKIQGDWRWCPKCQGLYFAGGLTQGICPAGGAHEHTDSGNYQLVENTPAGPGEQSGWRWCKKCHGLYFSSQFQSVCPAKGPHDHISSGDYTLKIHASE